MKPNAVTHLVVIAEGHCDLSLKLPLDYEPVGNWRPSGSQPALVKSQRTGEAIVLGALFEHKA